MIHNPPDDIPWGPQHPDAWGEVIFGVAREMSAAESLTTAIYSVWLCNPVMQQVTVSPQGKLSEKVQQAIEIIKRKTPNTRLEIAIELLNNLQDQDYGEKGPGLPDPDEIEVDDDPYGYGYITPALDEDEEDDSGLSGEFEEEDDSIYHGCDGDDFDPYLGM